MIYGCAQVSTDRANRGAPRFPNSPGQDAKSVFQEVASGAKDRSRAAPPLACAAYTGDATRIDRLAPPRRSTCSPSSADRGCRRAIPVIRRAVRRHVHQHLAADDSRAGRAGGRGAGLIRTVTAEARSRAMCAMAEHIFCWPVCRISRRGRWLFYRVISKRTFRRMVFSGSGYLVSEYANTSCRKRRLIAVIPAKAGIQRPHGSPPSRG